MLLPRGTLAAASAVLCALAATACGASTPAVPTRPVALKTGATAPDAGPHAVLKLSGRLRDTNARGQLRLGEATLEQLGLMTISLYEPFEKRRMSFRAIPLRNLLALAGLQAGATTLHAVALNDYVVDLPVGIAEADGVYLALGNGDGSPIAVEKGGPIRIVFADGAKGGEIENYWIWSLATVSAR